MCVKRDKKWTRMLSSVFYWSLPFYLDQIEKVKLVLVASHEFEHELTSFLLDKNELHLMKGSLAFK